MKRNKKVKNSCNAHRVCHECTYMDIDPPCDLQASEMPARKSLTTKKRANITVPEQIYNRAIARATEEGFGNFSEYVTHLLRVQTKSQSA